MHTKWIWGKRRAKRHACFFLLLFWYHQSTLKNGEISILNEFTKSFEKFKVQNTFSLFNRFIYADFWLGSVWLLTWQKYDSASALSRHSLTILLDLLPCFFGKLTLFILTILKIYTFQTKSFTGALWALWAFRDVSKLPKQFFYLNVKCVLREGSFHTHT